MEGSPKWQLTNFDIKITIFAVVVVSSGLPNVLIS